MVMPDEDLTALGWSAEPWDTCWLECSASGHCRQVNGKVICLCPAHARVLEAGRFNGDYEGAPLPPETMHASWPWRDPATMDAQVPQDAQDADPDPVMMAADGSEDAEG